MNVKANDANSDEYLNLVSRRILPDPNEIGALLFRRRYIFAIGFLSILAITACLLLWMPRTYTATSALLLEPRETEHVKVNDRGYVAPVDDNLIDTAVQIIRSPAVILSVVQKLKLDRHPEFTANVASKEDSLAQDKSTKLNSDISEKERIAAATLFTKTQVRRVGVTYLVDISATSASPKMAADIANALANGYIELSTTQKNIKNNLSSQYVEGKAASLRHQAVQDDTALQHYMIRNNLMSAEGATMAEQEVSELNRQIADAQAQVAEQRGKLSAAQAQIARGGGGADISSALSSETIRQLRNQESQTSARLAQLDARYGALHPEVVQAREELSDVRGQLEAELSRIISGLRADVQIAESRLNSLLGSRSQAKSSLAQNGAAQVGRLELERKAEASRAIYNAYLTRAKETASSGEIPNADASIAARARAPLSPSSPNYLLGGIAGFIAACVFGLGAVLVAEYLENTVSTRVHITQDLASTYAGAVPSLASVAHKKGIQESVESYLVTHPMSLFTESFRNLATFLGLFQNSTPTVIAITSALPKEGKSTTSLCIARTLAMGKRKVALIDLDVRRHTLSDSIAPERDKEGLFRVLNGQISTDEAFVDDPLTPLKALTTLGPKHPDDLITEQALSTLISHLRKQFDVIVLDTAPALGIAETRIATRLANTTLVIARWRSTPVKALSTTLDLLSHNDAKIGGIALNFVNIKEYASAGLNDAFGYYHKFKGYYAD